MLVANVNGGECKRHAVARAERSTVKAADAATNIRGGAAQQRRNVRPALDGEIGTDRIAEPAYAKHVAAHESHAPAGGNDAHTIGADRDIRIAADERDANGIGKNRECRPLQKHFQRGHAGRITDERVRKTQADPIERTGSG